MSRAFSLAFRIIALGICLYVVGSGHYPPLRAQTSSLTAEDATQDANIAAINKHMETTDANVLRQETSLSAIALAQAETQAEVRIFSAILIALIGGSITIQIATKTKKIT